MARRLAGPRHARLAARMLVGAGVTALLVACRASGPGGEANGPAAGPAAATLSSARLEAMVLRLVGVMVRYRGLPGTRPRTIAALPGREVKARAERAIRALYSQADLELTRRIEIALGHRPPGPTLDGPPGAVPVEIAGMYDPAERSLIVDAAGTAGSLEFMVAHEVVHYLQDVHFDLVRLTAPIPGDSDAEAARSLLVEGDANAACAAWETDDRTLAATDPAALRRQGAATLDAEGVFDHPVLGCTVMLSYNYAAATMIDLVRERGWAGADAAFRDPPTTTEQMLHPAMLLAREPAIPIAARPGALALAGHAVVRQDTLGEATLFCMLAAVAPAAHASAAAAGWGGGRIVAFERAADPGPAPLIVGLTAWDSEGDAAEFEPMMRRYLQDRLPGRHALERRGARVLFVTQLPTDAPPGLVERAWAVFSPAAG